MFTGHANKNPTSSIRDAVSSMAESIAYPNKDEKLGFGEHDAAHGASLVEHNAPEGVWETLHGEDGLRQLKSQGNQGQGHDSGLKRKGVEHQEQLAERTRLAREGLFEPHMKHDAMINLDDEHRDVAQGSQLNLDGPPSAEEGGLGKQVNEQKLI
ncbi:hypothetical protein JCM10207_008202 [Rhodosporidiobolus poonsookiae]